MSDAVCPIYAAHIDRDRAASRPRHAGIRRAVRLQGTGERLDDAARAPGRIVRDLEKHGGRVCD